MLDNILRILGHKTLRRDSFFLFIFCGIAIVAALIKGQNFCWDCLHYHYYNGWAFLNNRLSIDVTPADGLRSYFPPMLDAIEYKMFIVLPPVIFLSLLGVISGIGIFYCFLVNEIILKNANIFVGLLATLISCTGVAHVMQLGSITNENIVAVFLIMATYYLILYYQDQKKKYLVIVGVVLGIAIGFKLTAVTAVIAMLITFSLQHLNVRRNLLSYILIGTSLIGAVFLFNGFWMMKMYQLFHNPVYPNFNNLFNPGSGLDFSRDPIYLPKDISSWILLPFKLMIKTPELTDFSAIRDWHFAFALLAIVLLLFRKYVLKQSIVLSTATNKNVSSKQISYILSTFVIGYLLWEWLFAIQRYTIFFEYLSGTIAVYTVLLLTEQNSTLKKRSLILLVFCMSATIKSANLGYVPLSADIKRLPAKIKIEHALVILENGTSYLAPQLGTSNVYINDFFAQFTDNRHYIAKAQLLEHFLALHQDVYLVYEAGHEDSIRSMKWLIDNHLILSECKYIDAFKMSRRVICKLQLEQNRLKS